MTGLQALLKLEACRYSISLTSDGKIKIVPPGTLPPDAGDLMEALRTDKDGAVFLLKQRVEGATVIQEDEQVLKTENYLDIKALKLALDAGEIELRKIVFYKSTGFMIAFWRPLIPLPFLDMDGYRQAILGHMEALLQDDPTPDGVEEYNLLAS